MSFWRYDKSGMRKRLRILIVSFVGLSAFFLLFRLSSAQSFADDIDVKCQQQSVNVKLSSLDVFGHNMVTWLCWHGDLKDKTVQLVIHGLTYDHTYWDFPYQQPNYSYVKNAANAGYAVLNIDRIGSGLSDHPNDTEVSGTSGAFTIHQLVTDLRTGIFANTQFSKIILVGHSAGSGMSLLEVSSYQDVDGMILSGFAHAFNPAAFTLIATDFYPATLDPKFANSGYSPGYLTTVPGTRSQLFYNLPDADPNVITLDETLKQTATSEELADLPIILLPNVSLSIHVPVIIANGQFDQLLCGTGTPCDNSQAMLAREQSFFSPNACLEAFILPNSGHDINLHLNSASWYALANDWANRRVGNSTKNSPTQPCL